MAQLVQALLYKPADRGVRLSMVSLGSTQPLTEINNKVKFSRYRPVWPRGWVEV